MTNIQPNGHYVFNPTSLDRCSDRHHAITGQVIKVKGSQSQAYHYFIESLDGKDLGFVMGLSLMHIPSWYNFDPTTGMPRNVS